MTTCDPATEPSQPYSAPKCHLCGDPIPMASSRSKFCCAECQQEAARRRKGLPPRSKEEILHAQRERQRRRQSQELRQKKEARTPWWLRLPREEMRKAKRRRARPRPPAQIERYGVTLVRRPDHPRARGGRVPAHDLAMEQEIGRTLEPRETVVHINGNKKDNRPENLYLCKDAAAAGKARELLRERLWEFLREKDLEDKALRFLKGYDERKKREGMEYAKEHGLPRVMTSLGFTMPVMPGSAAWTAYGFDRKISS